MLPETLAIVPAYVFSRCIKLQAIVTTQPTGGTSSSVYSSENGLLYERATDGTDALTLIAAPPALGTTALISSDTKYIEQGAFAANTDLSTIVVTGIVEGIETGETIQVDGQTIQTVYPAFNQSTISNAKVALNVSHVDTDAAKAVFELIGFTHFSEPAVPGTEVLPSTETTEGEDGEEVKQTSGFAFTLLDDYTLSVRWEAGTNNDLAPQTVDIPTQASLNDVTYTVSSIADDAFKGQTSLEAINIPNTITSIGARAFEGTSIQAISIPGSVTEIGSNAFANNEHLSAITLNDGLETIGESALSGIALSSLVLPSSVKSVGDYAFANSPNLKQIVVLGTYTQASPTALEGVTSANIYIPYTEDGEYTWSVGAPVAGNHLLPYGVKMQDTPLELEVGQTAYLFEEGYLEVPDGVEVNYSYKAKPLSINTEDGTATGKQAGASTVEVVLEIAIGESDLSTDTDTNTLESEENTEENNQNSLTDKDSKDEGSESIKGAKDNNADDSSASKLQLAIASRAVSVSEAEETVEPTEPSDSADAEDLDASADGSEATEDTDADSDTNAALEAGPQLRATFMTAPRAASVLDSLITSYPTSNGNWRYMKFNLHGGSYTGVFADTASGDRLKAENMLSIIWFSQTQPSKNNIYIEGTEINVTNKTRQGASGKFSATRPGYRLLGWTKNGDTQLFNGRHEWNGETYHAQWAKINNASFTVNPNGGSFTATGKYPGKYSASTNFTSIITTGSTANTDGTLSLYDAGEGTTISKPTKGMATFLYWDVYKNGTKVGSTQNGSYSLYDSNIDTRWEIRAVYKDYRHINIDANGGLFSFSGSETGSSGYRSFKWNVLNSTKLNTNQTVNIGCESPALYSTISAPTKNDQHFQYWDIINSSGQVVGNTKSLSSAYIFTFGNWTLRAHWTDEVTLTVNPDGGSYSATGRQGFRATTETAKLTYLTGFGQAYVEKGTQSIKAFYNGTATTATNMTTITAPTKYGFDFSHWSWSGGNSSGITANKTIPEGATVTAIYKQKPDKVITFNSQGGSSPQPSAVVAKNENPTPTLENYVMPTKAGSTFFGWNEKADGTGRYDYDRDGKPLVETWDKSNNVTLYAIWNRTITITFDSNGATTAGTPTSITFDPIAGLPDLRQHGFRAPVKSGETFQGYRTTDNKFYYRSNGAPTEGMYYADFYDGTTQITLYAQFQPQSGGIHLIDNGADEPPCPSWFISISGRGITSYTMPKKYGYTLDGWEGEYTCGRAGDWRRYNGKFLHADGSPDGSRYPSGTSLYNVNSDITAIWEQNFYKIKFDANGGSGGTTPADMTDMTYHESRKVSGAVAHTRDGELQDGWSLTPNGPRVYDLNPTLKDVVSVKGQGETGLTATLYAHYSNYKITIDPDGGSFNLSSPTGDILGTYTSNLQLEKVFTLSVWAGNTVEQILTITQGSNTTRVNPVPRKEGYVFDHWEITGATSKSTAGMTGGWTYNLDGDIYVKAFYKPLTTYSNIVLHNNADTTLGAEDTSDAKPIVSTDIWATNANMPYNMPASYDLVNHFWNQAGKPNMPAPTRPGYVFAGFYDSRTGGTKYLDVLDTTYQMSGSFPAPSWFGAKVGTNSIGTARLWDKADSTVHLYAHWEPVTYTIKFEANGFNGGAVPPSVTLAGDQEHTIPSVDLVQYNYVRIFEGWATSPDGPVVYDKTATLSGLTSEPGATVSLYAQGSLRKVTIDPNGGIIPAYSDRGTQKPSSSSPITVESPNVNNTFIQSDKLYLEAGSSCSIYNPTREGYVFDGWFVSGNGDTYVRTYGRPSGQNVFQLNGNKGHYKFVANWKLAPKTCTIHFDKNSDDAVDGIYPDVTATSGQAMPTIPGYVAPTRPGYTLQGWKDAPGTERGGYYYDENGNSLADDGWDKQTEEPQTLYADWAIDVNAITLNKDGGTGGDSFLYVQEDIAKIYRTYDNAAETISDEITEENAVSQPTKEGFRFRGYYGADDVQYINPSGKLVNNAATVASEATDDITWTAKWVKTEITISFDPKGGMIEGSGTNVVNKTQTTADDATVAAATFPATPTKEGAKFVGWFESDTSDTRITTATILPTEDTTYYAQWAYEITLDPNGGTQTLASDIADSKIYAWTNHGYTKAVEEWTDSLTNNPALIGADDILVEEVERPGWTPNGYKNGNTLYIKTDGTLNSTSTTIAEAQTWKVEWTGSIITINFNLAGGNILGATTDVEKTQTMAENAKIAAATFPAAPTKENAVFVGWFTDASNSTTRITTQTALPTEDTTYYAQWAYEITLDANEGTQTLVSDIVDSKIYAWTNHGYTKAVEEWTDSLTNNPALISADEVLVESASRPGWLYGGHKNEGTRYIKSDGKLSSTSTTIAAAQTWKIEWAGDGLATIHFDPKGGTIEGSGTEVVTNTQVISDGATIESAAFPAAPTKTGAVFVGWFTNDTNSETRVTTSTALPIEETTYYAQWAYEITLDPNEGAQNLADDIVDSKIYAWTNHGYTKAVEEWTDSLTNNPTLIGAADVLVEEVERPGWTSNGYKNNNALYIKTDGTLNSTSTTINAAQTWMVDWAENTYKIKLYMFSSCADTEELKGTDEQSIEFTKAYTDTIDLPDDDAIHLSTKLYSHTLTDFRYGTEGNEDYYQVGAGSQSVAVADIVDKKLKTEGVTDTNNLEIRLYAGWTVVIKATLPLNDGPELIKVNYPNRTAETEDDVKVYSQTPAQTIVSAHSTLTSDTGLNDAQKQLREAIKDLDFIYAPPDATDNYGHIKIDGATSPATALTNDPLDPVWSADDKTKVIAHKLSLSLTPTSSEWSNIAMALNKAVGQETLLIDDFAWITWTTGLKNPSDAAVKVYVDDPRNS